MQDAFRPMPGLFSCAGVTGNVGVLCHAQMAGLIESSMLGSHSMYRCPFNFLMVLLISVDLILGGDGGGWEVPCNLASQYLGDS